MVGNNTEAGMAHFMQQHGHFIASLYYVIDQLFEQGVYRSKEFAEQRTVNCFYMKILIGIPFCRHIGHSAIPLTHSSHTHR